jgi:hypothetical protein
MLPQSTQLLTEKSQRKRQPVASSEISHTFGSQHNNSFHHGFLTKTLGLVSGAVLAAGTFFGAFGVAPHAAEALNFSNTGSTAAVSPGSNSWYATSFTIDTGYYLDQLVIQSASSAADGANNLSAAIYSNNSGTPNTAIAPVSTLSGTFTSSAGQVILTPNNGTIGNGGTYWLVVQGDASGGDPAASLRILNSPASSGSGGSVNSVLALGSDTGSGFLWNAANTSDAIELAFTVSVPFEFSPVGGVAILATGYGVHQLIKRRRAAAKTEAESTEKTPV